MPHSFNKLWIHAIWSTKNRTALIHPSFERQIHNYLKDQLNEMGCPVRIINGMPDHVHCLFLLNPQKSIAEIIKHLKGSSSYFVNESDLTKEKFLWQTGYAAYSVSESMVEKVFYYILNQKAHHNKKSFEEEYEGILKLYGFSKN